MGRFASFTDETAPVATPAASPVAPTPTQALPLAPVTQSSGWQFKAPDIGGFVNKVGETATNLVEGVGTIARLASGQTTTEVATQGQQSSEVNKVIRGIGGIAQKGMEFVKNFGEAGNKIANAALTGGPTNTEIANHYGGQYTPDYKPGIGEVIASEITRPIRSMGEALGNALGTDTKQYSLAENATKFGAGAAEQALNIFTLGEVGSAISAAKVVGKTGLTAAEIALRQAENPAIAAELKALQAGSQAASFGTKMAGVAAKIGHSALEGAKYGSLYGGLYSLQQYPADWKKAMDSAITGGIDGAKAMSFLSGIGVLGAPVLGFVSKNLEPAIAGIKNALAEHLPQVLSSETLFKIKGDYLIKQGLIDEGTYFKNLPEAKMALSAESTYAAGKMTVEMIDAGMISTGSSFVKKGLGIAEDKFHLPGGGGDEEAMLEGSRIMRGEGKYADPKVQAKAIKTNPIFQISDRNRVVLGATAQEKGLLKTAYDPRTYAPQITTVTQLTPKAEKALAKATTPEQEAAAYAANNVDRTRELNYAVERKQFPDFRSSAKAYYDYTSFVKGDGRVANKENSFLKWIVDNDKSGKIETNEDAAQVLLKQESNKQQALTGRATSLDYKRTINLPWFDTNIARTMSTYSLDAATRIPYADFFGPGDEKIRQVLMNIEKTTKLGQAGGMELKTQLEDLVQRAFDTKKFDSRYVKAMNFMRVSQALKLDLSAIHNLGQSLNNPLVADLPSTIKGLGKLYDKESFREMMQSGVLSTSFAKQAYEFNNGKSVFADAAYKWTGFSSSEMLNRAGAASTSNVAYETIFNKLAKDYEIPLSKEGAAQGKALAAMQEEMDLEVANEFHSLRKAQPKADAKVLYQIATDKIAVDYPELASQATDLKTKKDALVEKLYKIEQDKPPEYWKLKEAGLNIDDALARGYMTPEEKAAAAFRFTDATQFGGDMMSLPYFASSPLGKVVFQFKSFGYRQSKLALSVLKNQLVRGQYVEAAKTVLYLGTIVPIGNAALDDVRSLISGSKVPTTAFDQWHDHLFDAASFGLVSDFIDKANQGHLVDWAIGPSAEDVAAYLGDVTVAGYDITQGNVKDVVKQTGNFIKTAARQAGLAPIVNRVAPSKNAPGATMNDIITGKSRKPFFGSKK